MSKKIDHEQENHRLRVLIVELTQVADLVLATVPAYETKEVVLANGQKGTVSITYGYEDSLRQLQTAIRKARGF